MSFGQIAIKIIVVPFESVDSICFKTFYRFLIPLEIKIKIKRHALRIYLLCLGYSCARDVITSPQNTDKPSTYFTEASKFV